MNFLLDTNVISEWVKPRPDSGVATWLAGADEDRVFVSVISLTELRYGIERLPAGARRQRLERWLQEELPGRFEGRVLPVDGEVADISGRLMAHNEAIGRTIGTMDVFIAATARVQGLTLVTHNVSHFEAMVKPVVNPWAGA